MDYTYERLISNRELVLCTDDEGNRFYGCKHCGNRIDSIDNLQVLDKDIFVCPKCHYRLYPG